ncbi:hypothetical protein VKT23_002189 [Stygiomarasmius scandens]|uniref:Uncharacterized protein n=1 Tax=Marasmiellus scandens TaxID=2682957 RepID=A0ABR1K187_9AGAR
MCYPEGSVDHAVNVCPMCKVFPHQRCPHVREICRNRENHPRKDVLYLKNAEVDCFNGCGYCKWARTNPPPKLARYNNPGWPGCCRPPSSNEYRLIQLTEWKAVSAVHNIPIPPEIKATLDSLSASRSSSAASRSPTSRPAMPSFDRRTSTGGSPPTKSSVSPAVARTASSSVAAKVRSGGSPKQTSASLSGSLSKSTAAAALSNSTSASSTDPHLSRRAPITDATDKSRPAQNSPSRKQLDLDNSATPRRNSASRSSTSPPTKVPVADHKSASQSPERRRTAPSSSTAASSSSKSPTASSRGPAPVSSTTPRTPRKDDSAGSSAGSDNRSSSDYSDSTITSDGGFTDYLSDESEAELQRQAEAKAALLAQMQLEENEFRAARQQLAHVDLRPPKSWTPTNITNNTAPRLAQTQGAKGG